MERIRIPIEPRLARKLCAGLLAVKQAPTDERKWLDLFSTSSEIARAVNRDPREEDGLRAAVGSAVWRLSEDDLRSVVEGGGNSIELVQPMDGPLRAEVVAY